MSPPVCGFMYATGTHCKDPATMAYAPVFKESGSLMGSPRFRCNGHSDTWHLAMKVKVMTVEEAVVQEILDS